MEAQRPSIARMVHYHARPDEISNGAHLFAAVVTRVWSDRCVNLTIFPDNAQPFTRTSVELADERDIEGRWLWPKRA